MYDHEWNPDYFVNPPAFTYVLNLVFTVWFGGRSGVSEVLAGDPSEVWVVARTTSAVMGTLAVWFLYLAGSRLVDRRVGLLAAALLTFSFLPVFYSHLALNDVPTLAPLCFGAVGRRGRAAPRPAAGLRDRRRRPGARRGDEVHGRHGPLPAAHRDGDPVRRPGRARGRRCAGSRSPADAPSRRSSSPTRTCVLDFPAFWDGITHQSSAAGGETQGKLGLTHGSGVFYYVWSFTWGLGWIPLLAAVAAIPLMWRDERRLRLGPRAGDAALRRVHGDAGALLRPLADPGLPVRLHPRGVRGDRPRRPRRRAVAALQADVPRRRRDPAARAGDRLLAAHRPGPVPRGHAQPRPRVDGRARRAEREGRRRAGRPGRLGAGHRQPVAAVAERQPVDEVPDVALDGRTPRTPTARRCPSPATSCTSRTSSGSSCPS